MAKLDKRIVVFLDVMGFRSMIKQFESEALANEGNLELEHLESPSLNKYLNILDNAISLISNSNCNYYLFSDNICITLSYTENEDSFLDTIKLVCTLMHDFSQEGYFLRGGIDVGWMFDSDDIAVGIPLTKAYLLESEKAIYPRVLISDSFIKIITDDDFAKKMSDSNQFIRDKYFLKDNTYSFINFFYYISSFEEKESKFEFLEHYNQIISNRLTEFSQEEKIYKKYEWLAKEYNRFIEHYANSYSDIDFVESDLFSDEDITNLLNLKIGL